MKYDGGDHYGFRNMLYLFLDKIVHLKSINKFSTYGILAAEIRTFPL